LAQAVIEVIQQEIRCFVSGLEPAGCLHYGVPVISQRTGSGEIEQFAEVIVAGWPRVQSGER